MSLQDRQLFIQNVTNDKFATSDKDLAGSVDIDFTGAEEAAVVRLHVPPNTPHARAAAAENGQNQDNVELRMHLSQDGPLLPSDVSLAARASNNVACSLLGLVDKDGCYRITNELGHLWDDLKSPAADFHKGAEHLADIISTDVDLFHGYQWNTKPYQGDNYMQITRIVDPSTNHPVLVGIGMNRSIRCLFVVNRCQVSTSRFACH